MLIHFMTLACVKKATYYRVVKFKTFRTAVL